MSHERLIDLLKRSGLSHQLHTHAPMRTYEDMRALALFPLEACLKSVPFQIKGGDWVLVTLRAADQADYKKVAALVGVKRDVLVRPAPDVMSAAFGVEPGALSPFPMVTGGCRVFIDAAIATLPQVYCGIGQVGITLEMATTDVIALAGAQVADLIKTA
jgi:Cys-tRNA(Pro)/Cys-tRNA(Cys) deacylase